ncbi:MAG: hypothetical protein FWE24_03840 [Defluviitaleaceae bacterium]|nr:hypothetical protein [Defluviitaleaceae bacterium]
MKILKIKCRIFPSRQVLHEKSKTDFSWDQRETAASGNPLKPALMGSGRRIFEDYLRYAPAA